MRAGQNVAGFTELTATGPAGTKIYLRHGENLEGMPGPTTDVRNGYCGNSGRAPTVPAGDETPCHCGGFNYANGSSVPVVVSAVFGGNCANQTNLFILAGTGHPENYRPRFTYAGFRYVQMYGWPAGSPEPTVDTLLQHFVHSDVSRVGAIKLPAVEGTTRGVADILNTIQHITLYAQLSNLWSIPTDCACTQHAPSS